MYSRTAITFVMSGLAAPMTMPSGSTRGPKASRSSPKDSDFHQLSFLRGHPPKVVWIRRGNCSTDEIESLLRQHEADLRAFEQDSDASFLVLS